MDTNKELKGIQRYYHRLMQNEYGNTYYIEPRETCPLDVLNDRQRFVILTFDKEDDYIVVDNRRYYLNKTTAIKATDNIKSRVAVVDLTELANAKSYPFEDRYRHQYTAQFDSFEELKRLANQQWLVNGSPYLKQVAQYDSTTKQTKYYYEPSCDNRLAIA
ncbi:hypothetical protein H5W18_09205 [Lactobacillus sp. Marseille-P7033]|nr:hypothetical protein [Lactobacillus sp. Marseille-P7033]NGC77159.1 hypothetical protein [Limosilactobacillus reuteri]